MGNFHDYICLNGSGYHLFWRINVVVLYILEAYIIGSFGNISGQIECWGVLFTNGTNANVTTKKMPLIAWFR